MRLLFETGDQLTGPLQGHIKIVDAEEQKQTIAWRRRIRTHQGGMLVVTPSVETEQDGSIGVEDLTKVVMSGRCLGLAEERLIPFETTRHVSYADDHPRAFHDTS